MPTKEDLGVLALTLTFMGLSWAVVEAMIYVVSMIRIGRAA